MQLRFIYALLGVLVGIIIAYSFTAFLMTFLGGTLWMYIFGNNPWPTWTGSLLITAGLVSFFGALIGCTLYGYHYGLKLEQNTTYDTYFSKAITHLAVGLVIFAVLGGSVAYRTRLSSLNLGVTQEQAAKNKIQQSLKKIKNIEINQLNNGIEVVASVEGPTDDNYELTLDLVARKFAQESIFQQTQPIELKFKEQSFHFELPFDEIGKQYRKILENYVLNFNKPLSVDEIFDVQLKLKLLGTPIYKGDQIEKFEIPPQTDSALLRMSFNCSMDQCKVFQKDENSSNPKQ